MSFYHFTSTSIADATQLMANFAHIFDGSRIPMSVSAGGTLTACDGEYDIGSSAYRWKDLYCNNIIVASSTVTAPYMWTLKSTVTLSSTATSIEFTGLNGDNYDNVIMGIRFVNTAGAGSGLFKVCLNNDTSSSYYVSYIYLASAVGVVASSTTYLLNAYNIEGFCNINIQTKTGNPRISEFVWDNNYVGHQCNIGHSSWSDITSTLTSIKLYCYSPASAHFQAGTTIKLWSRN